MKAAELSSKFRNLRNLKLAKTTLYELADHEPESDLPAIIAELAKHATKKRLPPRDAERIIKIGIGRGRFGDYPDATLARLAELNDRFTWCKKAVAALQKKRPKTDEEAKSITDTIMEDHLKAERETLQAGQAARQRELEHEEEEAEAILDGPPPAVPSPATAPEGLKFGSTTSWAERDPFTRALEELHRLRGKPVERFVGAVSSAEMREVIDFLTAVLTAEEAEANAV
jgi:hypothetical protein